MPAYEMRISYWSSDVCSSDLILRKVALLLPNRGPDDFIFANRKGGMISDMTISKVMRDDDQPYVPHGFRTSLRTWAAEKQPFIPEPVAEAALYHVIPDAVIKAYNRATFLDKNGRASCRERECQYV